MKTETITIEISWNEETDDQNTKFNIPGAIPVTAIIIAIDKIEQIVASLTRDKLGKAFENDGDPPFDEIEQLTFADIAPQG